MKEKFRDEVNCLSQKINKKKRLLFQKLEKDEFEDATLLRDEIKKLQQELLVILDY